MQRLSFLSKASQPSSRLGYRACFCLRSSHWLHWVDSTSNTHTCRPLDPSTPSASSTIQPVTGYSLSERLISASSRLFPTGTRLAPFAEPCPPPKTSRSTPWLSGCHHLQVARNLEPARIHSSAAGQRHWCRGYPSARRSGSQLRPKRPNSRNAALALAQHNSRPRLSCTCSRVCVIILARRSLANSCSSAITGRYFSSPFPLLCSALPVLSYANSVLQGPGRIPILLEGIRRMIQPVRPVLCSRELMDLFQLASDLVCPAF